MYAEIMYKLKCTGFLLQVDDIQIKSETNIVDA